MALQQFPISFLKNNLDQIILTLKFKDLNLTLEEINRRAIDVNDFFKELNDNIYVILEDNYVDVVYRDSYYDYYSTKSREYNRFCIRLSFFKSKINFSQELNTQQLQNNYLGFLIIRPLKACVGRNIISPEAKINLKTNQPMTIEICRVSIESSCLGIKLIAKGFPHASQDSETMTCAQTTIWAILEYFGNKYSYYSPTTPSEIEEVLEPFSYERLLPSKGLNVNQISVALRKFGFGPKIYSRSTLAGGNSLFELLACYIESGIPLAVTMANRFIGHAVVCVGVEKVDKSNVKNSIKTIGSKSQVNIMSWNITVSNGNFVFNDDNFPCYQLAKLNDPVRHYIDYPIKGWENFQIENFIAPLYFRVYMEADTAITLSEEIITSCLSIDADTVMKTFLTSSRTYREYLSTNSTIPIAMRLGLLQLPMPKFIWISELSTYDEFINDKVNTILLLDATGSKMADLSKNIILFISKGDLYRYDNTTLSIKGFKTQFPKVIEAFGGNLN